MTPELPAAGVLPVDKPEGPTSHDVVARARRALGVRKVGHTGTLDPFASGLLLLCVGGATRLSEYLTGLDKEYLAVARLGRRTDTGDREGEVVEEREGWDQLDGERVVAALERFRGEIRQRPPAYSAKKVGGEPAHRRARRGEEVELEPVTVTVHAVDLVDWSPPDLRFRVRCSSGTYVRALARDLGEELGVGAHLTELRRTAVGQFDVADAVPADDLDEEHVREAWITPTEALGHLPRVEVDREEEHRLATGRGVEAPEALRGRGGPVAAVRDGRLVAVTTVRGASLRPRKVFVQP